MAFAKIPREGSTNAYFPYCGTAAWKRAATGGTATLRSMLRSKADGEIWSAISESAWRRDTANVSELIALAGKGWAPAAYALSEIPGSDKSTALSLRKSNSIQVRTWAGYALAQSGDARGAEGLWEYLRANDHVHRTDLGGPTRTDYATALMKFYAKDAKRLEEAYHLSRNQRLTIIIAEIPTTAAHKALVNLTTDKYHGVRQWALFGLAMRADGRPIIERVAQQQKHPDTAKVAKSILANLASGKRLSKTRDGQVRWT